MTNIRLKFIYLQEELMKVQKFRYQQDALASLLGRLFLRQVCKNLF